MREVFFLCVCVGNDHFFIFLNSLFFSSLLSSPLFKVVVVRGGCKLRLHLNKLLCLLLVLYRVGLCSRKWRVLMFWMNLIWIQRYFLFFVIMIILFFGLDFLIFFFFFFSLLRTFLRLLLLLLQVMGKCIPSNSFLQRLLLFLLFPPLFPLSSFLSQKKKLTFF